MWDVQDVGCLGCGDVESWGYGMFEIWDVWDVGCGVVEFLQGCRMLIYKMPDFFNVDTVD